jgi:hypothetical protein
MFSSFGTEKSMAPVGFLQMLCSLFHILDGNAWPDVPVAFLKSLAEYQNNLTDMGHIFEYSKHTACVSKSHWYRFAGGISWIQTILVRAHMVLHPV